MEAARVAELEAAQSAAQAALMAEMALLRRQKAAAEEHSRRMEASVRPRRRLAWPGWLEHTSVLEHVIKAEEHWRRMEPWCARPGVRPGFWWEQPLLSMS